jgi:hypothetical protein
MRARRLVAARRLHETHTASPPKWPTTRSETPTALSSTPTTTARAASIRIIGYSILANDIITVIVVEHEGTEYGVNGWSANAKDRRIYNAGNDEAEQGEADEQD